MILQFEDLEGEKICVAVNDNLNSIYTSGDTLCFSIGTELTCITYRSKEEAHKAFANALALIGSRSIVLGVTPQ